MTILNMLMKIPKADCVGLTRRCHMKLEPLLESNIKAKDPFSLFLDWLQTAVLTKGIVLPQVVALATVNKKGFPTNRFVMIREVTPQGLIFLTDYGSNKAKHIEINQNVAITFFWASLRRQVRIEGRAIKIPRNQSLNYFKDTPVQNQIIMAASQQSSTVPSREFLDKTFETVKEKAETEGLLDISNWGGYQIRPVSMEFYQGFPDRMHDRILFRRASNIEPDGVLVKKGDNGWVYERLAP